MDGNTRLRDQVMKQLHAHLDELRQRHVEAVYLFGSIARDEPSTDSDVDLLIEVRRPFTYFDLMEVQQYLETLLGRSVDVGTVQMIRDDLREKVMQEAVRAA